MHTTIDFWTTLFIFIMFGCFILATAPEVLQMIGKVSQRTLILLLIIIILGTGLRLSTPARHHVFYDEFAHLDNAMVAFEKQKIAKKRFDTHVFGEEEFHSLKWCPGYYVLLSTWWHIFDPTESTAFAFSRFLGIFTIPLGFLLGALLFQRHSPGIWLAFSIAAYPIHIKFSGGTSTEISSVFFCLAMLASVALHYHQPTLKTGLSATTGVALYILFRPENSFCGIPILIYLGWRLFRLFPASRPWLFPFLSLLFIPGLYHLYLAIKFERSFIHEQIHFPIMENLTFWFGSLIHPALYTALALVGLIIYLKKKQYITLLFLSAFLIHLSFYTFIHKSSFMHLDFSRYALNFSPFILIGLCAGVTALGSKNSWIRSGLVLAFIASTVYAMPTTMAPTRANLEGEIEFVLSSKENIPMNAVIFAVRPELIRVLHHAPARRFSLLKRLHVAQGLSNQKLQGILYIGLPMAGDTDNISTMLSSWGWEIQPLILNNTDGTLDYGFYKIDHTGVN